MAHYSATSTSTCSWQCLTATIQDKVWLLALFLRHLSFHQSLPHVMTVVGTHRLSSDNILLVCIVDTALAQNQAPAPVFNGGPGNSRTGHGLLLCVCLVVTALLCCVIAELCARPRTLIDNPAVSCALTGIMAPSSAPSPPEVTDAGSGCNSTCLVLSIVLPITFVAALAVAALLLLLCRGSSATVKHGSQPSIPATSQPSMTVVSPLSGSFVTAGEIVVSDVRICKVPHMQTITIPDVYHNVAWFQRS